LFGLVKRGAAPGNPVMSTPQSLIRPLVTTRDDMANRVPGIGSVTGGRGGLSGGVGRRCRGIPLVAGETTYPSTEVA